MLLFLLQVTCQALPFVRTSHSLKSCQSKSTIAEKFRTLDSYCNAMLSNTISNRSSVNQGIYFVQVLWKF